MIQFVNNESSPTANDVHGHGSVANLLNRLEKAESQSLGWPTTKRKSNRIFNQPNIFLEAANQMNSVKSEFFNLLKLNEKKPILTNGIITSPPRRLSTSVQTRQQTIEKMPSSPSSSTSTSSRIYKVPSPRRLDQRPVGKSTRITDAILRMLQEISYRKAQEEKPKIHHDRTDLELGTPYLEINFPLRGKYKMPVYKAPPLSERSYSFIPQSKPLKITKNKTQGRKRKKRSEQDVLNISQTLVTNEMKGYLKAVTGQPQSKTLSKRIKKSHKIHKKSDVKNIHLTERTKKPSDVINIHLTERKKKLEKDQVNTINRVDQDEININQIAGTNAMKTYLKIISKISPTSDTSTSISSKYSYHKAVKQVSKAEPKGKNDQIEEIKSVRLSENYNEVTIADSLENSRRSSLKDIVLKRESDVRSERSSIILKRESDLRSDRSSTILKSISHAKKLKYNRKSKKSLDDISRDLANIEKMVSKGHSIPQSRKFLRSLGKRKVIPLKPHPKIHEDTVSMIATPTSNLSIPLDEGFNLHKSQSHMQLIDTEPTDKSQTRIQLIDTKPTENKQKDNQKYGDPLVVKRTISSVLPQANPIRKSHDLPVVRSITPYEFAKLTQEEQRRIFNYTKDEESGDTSSKRKWGSFISSTSTSSSIGSAYHADKIRKYFTEGDMRISEMEDISVSDIDINRYLHYPYDDKYYRIDSTKTSKVTSVVSKPTKQEETLNFKQKVQREIRKIRQLGELRKNQDKLVTKEQRDMELKKSVMEPYRVIIGYDEPKNVPKTQNCCICTSMHPNWRVKDDPLITKMKRELKRHELRAYIKEKQVYTSVLDEICPNISVDIDKPRFLRPCQKSGSNNIAKLLYRDIS